MFRELTAFTVHHVAHTAVFQASAVPMICRARNSALMVRQVRFVCKHLIPHPVQLTVLRDDLFKCAPPTASLATTVSKDFQLGPDGIGVLFQIKFRRVDELKAQKKGVGEVAVLKHGGRFLYYLIIKEKYADKPTFTTLRKCLVAMREHCLTNNVRELCMPKLGCGHDGMPWYLVEHTIKQDVFLHYEQPLKITVYCFD